MPDQWDGPEEEEEEQEEEEEEDDGWDDYPISQTEERDPVDERLLRAERLIIDARVAQMKGQRSACDKLMLEANRELVAAQWEHHKLR